MREAHVEPPPFSRTVFRTLLIHLESNCYLPVWIGLYSKLIIGWENAVMESFFCVYGNYKVKPLVGFIAKILS